MKVDGVHLHYLDQGEGPVLVHRGTAMSESVPGGFTSIFVTVFTPTRTPFSDRCIVNGMSTGPSRVQFPYSVRVSTEPRTGSSATNETAESV